MGSVRRGLKAVLIWCALSLVPTSVAAQASSSNELVTRQLAEQSIAFFQIVATGSESQITDFLSPDLKQSGNLSKLLEVLLSSKSKGLDFKTLKPLKVTLYQDPPNATPGLYGAVDFSTLRDARHFGCGFLIWYKNDEDFKILRTEVSEIGPDALSKLNKTAFVNLLRQLGCRAFLYPTLTQ